MPPAIDYRQTFLRWHIPSELDPPFTQEPGVREEVMALDNLRYRLRRFFPDAAADIHRLVSRRRFFLNLPDDKPWLYMPVGVRPLPHGDRGLSPEDRNHYDNLTDLLASTTKSGRSVLLVARSGAGKSTAMLKAFFDCFVGPDPPLGGCLPCYLRQLYSPRKAFIKARNEKSAGHEVILDLLAEAARLPLSPSSEQLEQWLKHSPPLLLFLDLNAAADDLRQLLPIAIIRFQEHFEGKHRWVVAYRSAGRDDPLLYLQQTGRFGTYDLLPLQYEDALRYFAGLQHMERELATELPGRHPQAENGPTSATAIDAKKLRQLFDRYRNSPDSLISTPLLMHFVSVIGIERAAKSGSLAQLYTEVVKDYLDRDYGSLDGEATTPYAEVVRDSGLMTPAGRTKIKVAMARVALAILASGPKETRLHPPEGAEVEEHLDRLLASPKQFREPDWWPLDPWWHEGRYYHEPFDPPACRALQEFSFLRRDGKSFGFLHDSFIYYFAALAVRFRKEPVPVFSLPNDEVVRAEWCRMAAERMKQLPESWQQPALFLGGMLRPEELRAVLPPWLTAEPDAGWLGILTQVAHGRWQLQGKDDVVLCQVERALSSRASELARYPAAIFPHVFNHLSWCQEPLAECHDFAANKLRPAMNATGRPWLRAETPMPPSRVQVFRCNSGINCLAVSAPGEFITGHDDGTVRRWRVDSGRDVILYKHEEKSVNSVAVHLLEGTVVSGGGDGTVRRWQRGDAVDTLYTHDGPVGSVAVNPQDGSVVSGGLDKTVRCWRPREEPSVLYRHEAAVLSVAADVRCGSLALLLGGADGTVRRWRPGETDAEVLCRHPSTRVRRSAAVSTLAVYRRCQVVFGGGDGKVRRWGMGVAKELYEHSWPYLHRDPDQESRVTCLAVDPRNGAVVSGATDGTVLRAERPSLFADEPLYEHEGSVSCVAVDPHDGSVLSAGEDKTVRRWQLDTPRDGAFWRTDSVSSVAVDARDGSVVSGGTDGKVRRWRSGASDGETLYEHKGVLAVAVDTRDGAEISKAETRRPEPWHLFAAEFLAQHGNQVRSTAVDIGDGAVLSGGKDYVVRRWQPGEAKPKLVYKHDDAGRFGWVDPRSRDFELPNDVSAGVLSVAVDAKRGSVVSGGVDGKVCRVLSRGRGAEMLYFHEGAVWSVAVDPRDGSVVSGGSDCTVRRWRPSEDTAETILESVVDEAIKDGHRHGDWDDWGEIEYGELDRVILQTHTLRDALYEASGKVLYEHDNAISSVAVDGRDGSVLSGGHDHTVRRWRQGDHKAAILYQHEHVVRSLAMDEVADSLISGGDDANLRLYRFARSDFLMLLTPYPIVSVACSLKHNRIALALADGRLVLVRVEPSVEPLFSHPASGKNLSPGASSQ